ncbi:MAG TPA: TRAP transporter small permease [Burkholderiaceae bacterium]|nr:TRAP transporter small permease [Burkholderiaceae bacterium]
MRGIGNLFATAAGILVLGMMLVTSLDVGLRFFFNAPLGGAFEVTEISMALVIFAGMSLAAARREHITVNLLETALSERARRWQRVLGDLVCAMVAAVLAWRIGIRAQSLLAAGETTLVLGIGRGYIAWTVAVLCAVAAGVFLRCAWQGLTRTGTAPDQQPGQSAL